MNNNSQSKRHITLNYLDILRVSILYNQEILGYGPVPCRLDGDLCAAGVDFCRGGARIRKAGRHLIDQGKSERRGGSVSRSIQSETGGNRSRPVEV